MILPFEIIVAVDKIYGIGKRGELPWHLKGDMQHFRETTLSTKDQELKNVVVMGRKTWESIPEKFRPLEGRINVVLSRNKDFGLSKEIIVAESYANACDVLKSQFDDKIDKIFIIGGAQLYQEMFVLPECRKIYLTQIDQIFDCDVFFPSNFFRFQITSESPFLKEGDLRYRFLEYSPSRILS